MAAIIKTIRHFQISRMSLSLRSNISRCLMSTKDTNNNETETNRHEENDPDNAAIKQKQNDDAIEEKNKLASTIPKLEEELKDYEDKYAQSLTELENLKTRLMKQVEDAGLFGIQGFSKDLLEVLDVLSTAITSVSKEELNSSNPHLMNLFEGLNKTKSELVTVFKKYGVEPLGPNQGDKFDPNCHEALFQDKYAQSLTELENLKTRLMKQVEDAGLFGIQGFSKDLLEVLDVLSTAITSVSKEELNSSNPHLMNLFEGLNKTKSELVTVFKKYGVEPLGPNQGDKFDPNCHEALFQVPIDSMETQVSDTVALVQQVGYRLHSRTLRPALVGVFKTPQ